MKKVICGVVAVIGCVLLTSASVADTAEARSKEKEGSMEVSLPEQASHESVKRAGWPVERPDMEKVVAKEWLKGRRPK